MTALPTGVRDCLRLVLALLVAACAASEALAGEILVTVDDVRSSAGLIVIDLCTRETFLGDDCPYSISAPAMQGHMEMVLADVPPGVYAVQAFHDENGNGRADRNLVGYPLEGFAFGNGVAPTVAAPSFDEAAVEIGEYGGLIELRMLYY